MRIGVQLRFTAMAAAVILSLPAAALAQRINTIKPTAAARQVTLDGVVRDPQGRPLAAAEIIVDDEHRAISNSRGEFSIGGLDSGLLQFVARRIGYQPVTTGVNVEQPGLTVHLAITLTPIAIELGTMIIEGRRMDKTLWQTGFYQRQQLLGGGQYFDDSYFRTHQITLGTVLSEVTSVYVDRQSNGNGIALGKMPNGSRCAMSVFVDGHFISWADQGVDAVVNRDDILALEVYPRASQMPTMIAGRGGKDGGGSIGTVNLKGSAGMSGPTTGECGAILIWTKPLGKR